MITIGKKGTLHAKRQLISKFQKKQILIKLLTNFLKDIKKEMVAIQE